jgi:hypothetical protein
MLIYAIFLCMQATQSCDIQSSFTDLDGSSTPAVYRSLADCESAIVQRVPGGAGKPDHGRFYWDTDKSIWYECLSRRVDTWEQP